MKNIKWHLPNNKVIYVTIIVELKFDEREINYLVLRIVYVPSAVYRIKNVLWCFDGMRGAS